MLYDNPEVNDFSEFFTTSQTGARSSHFVLSGAKSKSVPKFLSMTFIRTLNLLLDALCKRFLEKDSLLALP